MIIVLVLRLCLRARAVRTDFKAIPTAAPDNVQHVTDMRDPRTKGPLLLGLPPGPDLQKRSFTNLRSAFCHADRIYIPSAKK